MSLVPAAQLWGACSVLCFIDDDDDDDDDDDEMLRFSPKMNILRLSPVSTVNFLMSLCVDYD